MDKEIKSNIIKCRIYAFVADFIFIFFFNKSVINRFDSFLETNLLFDQLLPQHQIQHYLNNLSPIIFLCIFTAYFIIGHYLSNGLSLGKVIFQIRIYPEKDISFISLEQSLLITTSYYLHFITLGLLLLPTLLNKKNGFKEIISFGDVKSINNMEDEKNKNISFISSKSNDLKFYSKK